MTGSDTSWCADVAAVLLAASDQTARLAVRIAEDWLDDRGREWAERAALLHRELDRMATEAAHLGAQPDPALPVLPTLVVGTGRRGPRLGGTAGERADDAYGMSIAELPPG